MSLRSNSLILSIDRWGDPCKGEPVTISPLTLSFVHLD